MPYGVEGMWAAGVQLFVLARLRALRRCGRRVYNYSFWHALRRETPQADVSTWGSCSRLFEYAFGVGACVGWSG